MHFFEKLTYEVYKCNFKIILFSGWLGRTQKTGIKPKCSIAIFSANNRLELC